MSAADQALAKLLPDLVGAELAPLAATVMSPVHHAVENDLYKVTKPGAADAVLRMLRGDMRDDFDPQALVAGAMAAAACGAGPQVLAADAAAGTLVLEHLGAGWRTATLWDLQHADVRRAIIAATRRLHDAGPVDQRFDPFARLRTAIARARSSDVSLPADLDWLRDGAEQVAEAVAVRPAKPALCRNDGVSSNVMIHEDGRVLLLDYDQAGMNDPIYDLGVLVAEAAVFDDEAMSWVRDWDEGAGPEVLARARLYGAVDDLLWGMIAATQARVSERITVEFRKYSEWRLMRARRVIADRRFEEMLRIVEGRGQ